MALTAQPLMIRAFRSSCGQRPSCRRSKSPSDETRTDHAPSYEGALPAPWRQSAGDPRLRRLITSLAGHVACFQANRTAIDGALPISAIPAAAERRSCFFQKRFHRRDFSRQANSFEARSCILES
jgi:hypothetical protein